METQETKINVQESAATPWWMWIWSDGAYFDLWHVNHFLAGILLGYGIFYTKINMWVGFLISLTLMIAWELFEAKHQIQETSFNRLMDLILGIIGFFAFYYLSEKTGEPTAFILFLLCLVAWLILEVWGFTAYLKRSGT